MMTIVSCNSNSEMRPGMVDTDSRRQDSGRRGARSGLSFCTLLNGLTGSTVQKYHCTSMNVAIAVVVERTRARHSEFVGTMENPFREVFKEYLYFMFLSTAEAFAMLQFSFEDLLRQTFI